MRKLAQAAATVLLIAYGLTTTIFLVVRPLIGETTIVALLNRYFPLVLLLALPLLLICLWGRWSRLALLILPAAIVCLTSYAPLFLPRPTVVPSNAARLSVLTFNLGAIEAEAAPLAEVIRSAGADVVALQELSSTAASIIGPTLKDEYPYQALQPRQAVYDGHGVLSRYPLINAYSYPYQPARLRLQRVQINFHGRSLLLFNTHLQPVTESWRSPDVSIQRDQLDYLLDEMARSSGPRILVGDFNFNDQSSHYRQIINAGFNDAWRAVGWGMGFTNPVWSRLTVPDGPDWLQVIPVNRRIDFIFYDAAGTAESARVGSDSGGSDHYSLYSSLSLSGSETMAGNTQASASGNTPLNPTNP
ncbi:MAG: endonuclease/exonuclease/phosphatase family protein [Anaerolineae bacterium]|nr:endonuclease/exonuclease/phosphatase family protein [Anaerolineae bacterium]